MEFDCADGCLLGQLARDAFGSLVEFHSPEEISCNYLDGVWRRLMAVPGILSLGSSRTTLSSTSAFTDAG
jgi:ADP-ribosylglycohydrolase